MNRTNELQPDKAHFTFWLGVTYHLLNRPEEERASWDRTASLTGAETVLCLQQRVLAAITNLCQITQLRTEQGYLLLLAQLFPDRDDIHKMCEWFEGQLQQKSQQ